MSKFLTPDFKPAKSAFLANFDQLMFAAIFKSYSVSKLDIYNSTLILLLL